MMLRSVSLLRTFEVLILNSEDPKIDPNPKNRDLETFQQNWISSPKFSVAIDTLHIFNAIFFKILQKIVWNSR